MRVFVIVFVAMLIADLAFAAEPAPSKVLGCCIDVREVCMRVVYTPRCGSFLHECPTPLTPCAVSICPPSDCHKPLVTCTPSLQICLESVCHKPVVTLIPERDCECSPSITGSKNTGSGSCSDCS